MMQQKYMAVPATVFQCVKNLIGTDSINRWKNAFLYEVQCGVEESEKIKKQEISVVEATTTFS
jgi:hypothetical protein